VAGGKWAVLGKVRSLNVSRREVRIAPRRGEESRVLASEWAWFRIAGSPEEPLRCKVETRRPHGKVVIAGLSAGVPRETVAALRGAEMVAPVEDTPEGNEHIWYVEDLVGMKVRGPDDEPIGTVVAGFETAAHDVMEVSTEDGRRALLPVIEDLIEDVDPEEGTISVGDITPYAVYDHED
jgi:16S rRNA processing protein RimM